MTDARNLDASPTGSPALISFVVLAIWLLTIVGLFVILVEGVDIDPVLIGLLGGVLSTETAAVGAVTGFWLANSLNSNRAGAAKDAALSQIAGAGPPPPATPLETTSPPP